MQKITDLRMAFKLYKEGKFLYSNGLIEDSTEKYKQVLEILEKYNDDKNIAKIKTGIGLNYNVLGYYDRAIEILVDAYITFEKYKKNKDILETFNLCVLELSKSNFYKGNLKESLILSNKALNISKKKIISYPNLLTFSANTIQ